jgi:hypothetical protein
MVGALLLLQVDPSFLKRAEISPSHNWLRFATLAQPRFATFRVSEVFGGKKVFCSKSGLAGELRTVSYRKPLLGMAIA